MALYEYRCRTCDERFEVRRPMTATTATTAPPPCPDGHRDTVRVLSMFATTGGGAGGPAPSGGGTGAGGGCCGGSCGCAR
jgi:putative FmdB family regulatory protein